MRELKRNQYDIAANIIEVAKQGKRGGTRITEIMYGANLSWEQLQDYMDRMVSGGLLILEGKRYKPTGDAETWFDKYQDLRERTPVSLSPGE